MPAFEPSAPHAGTDPFDDQASLEFRDGADDDHDGASQRAAGINLLPEADELYVEPVELIEHFEEVPCRPGDAITCPDQHDVELAASGIAHQLVEARPAGLHAGDPVRVLVDDLEAALANHLAKVEELSFRVLVDGGDSHVKAGALHGRF